MKVMKKLTALSMILVFTFIFTSCGNQYSDIKILDYITIKDYKGITISKIKVDEVTDADVDSAIKERLNAKAKQVEKKSGKVERNDIVNIDYTGSIDGVKFDGGTGKGQSLQIGSGQFIPGFEDQLIGAEVGKTVNVKVQFPKEYHKKDMAGKNAIFAVKINSRKVTEVPKLDEKFVKENSKAKNIEEYKKLVKKEVADKRKKDAEKKVMESMWKDLVLKSAMKKDKDGKDKYPEKHLNDIIEKNMKMYEESASRNNMSLENYIQQQFRMKKADFDNQLKEFAKLVLKEDLIMYYIADKEDISVSGKEYDKYIEETLAQYGFDKESFEKANGKSYEEIMGKDQIERTILLTKVQQFILDNAKQK
ncbi:MAG: trigger factor [Eubacteriales bacterium]|nr:trigger factor [Eubacteriales bacterium]MDY3332683.1 trigger factor [Gallibacter sp.]